jgi:hypothetical protein
MLAPPPGSLQQNIMLSPPPPRQASITCFIAMLLKKAIC